MIELNIPKLLVPIGIALALNFAVWIYPDLQESETDSDRIVLTVSTIKGTV